jgi:hypothetical protein
MEEPQQVVYRYTIDLNHEPRITISWHPLSKVVHTALLDGTPDRVHFWVAMPVAGELPFTRTFYVVGTGYPFPATDIVEGVTVWDGAQRLVWHLIRHEPGHTTN